MSMLDSALLHPALKSSWHNESNVGLTAALEVFTVSLVPTWWISTPPNGFLPHLVSFYPTWGILSPTLKKIRNTMTYPRQYLHES